MYGHNKFNGTAHALANALAILALVAAATVAGNPGARADSAPPTVERVPKAFVGRLTVFKDVSVTNATSRSMAVALSRPV